MSDTVPDLYAPYPDERDGMRLVSPTEILAAAAPYVLAKEALAVLEEVRGGIRRHGPRGAGAENAWESAGFPLLLPAPVSPLEAAKAAHPARAAARAAYIRYLPAGEEVPMPPTETDPEVSRE